MLILDVFPCKNNGHVIAKTDVGNEKARSTAIFTEIWQFSFPSGMASWNYNTANVFLAFGKGAAIVKLCPKAKGLVYFRFRFSIKYSTVVGSTALSYGFSVNKFWIWSIEDIGDEVLSKLLEIPWLSKNSFFKSRKFQLKELATDHSAHMWMNMFRGMILL